jgi:nucleotidyltransferase/DNA polymerase involved in DNA repair
VDLPFADLRQLADIAAGLCDVGSRHRLGRITGELVEAVEYRAQLRECVQATMGSLRKQLENAVASS